MLMANTCGELKSEGRKDNIIRFTDNVCALLINKIKKFGELKKEKTSPPFLILTKWRHLPKLPRCNR